jgi:hypothetical protein
LRGKQSSAAGHLIGVVQILLYSEALYSIALSLPRSTQHLRSSLFPRHSWNLRKHGWVLRLRLSPKWTRHCPLIHRAEPASCPMGFATMSRPTRSPKMCVGQGGCCGGREEGCVLYVRLSSMVYHSHVRVTYVFSNHPHRDESVCCCGLCKREGGRVEGNHTHFTPSTNVSRSPLPPAAVKL